LPSHRDRLGARCPYCRDPLYESARPPRPPGPEDSLCAVHPENATQGTCQRCGNYLCPICRTRWHNQWLCAACVDHSLNAREKAPEEARAHRRQAILALVLGVGAWGMAVAGFLLLAAGTYLVENQTEIGLLLIIGGALLFLPSPVLSLLGIGQGAAAVRTRGDHLILATAGLLLSALHVGLLVGIFCSNIWQT
jgi:hypothetical protein